MEVKPLSPGLYICRFKQSVKADTLNHILKMLNTKGESFGVQFIPELPNDYQILNQVQEDNT